MKLNMAFLLMTAFLFCLPCGILAAGEKITPGLYKANSETGSMDLLLDMDGSGEFIGETHNAVEWKQDGDKLLITFFEEDGGEDSQSETATVLSPISFNLQDFVYKLDPATRPRVYAYAEKGMEGDLILQKKFSDSEEISLKIETAVEGTGNTCSVSAGCQDQAGKLVCRANDVDGDQDQLITITPVDTGLNVETTYAQSEFCGMNAFFAGSYTPGEK